MEIKNNDFFTVREERSLLQRKIWRSSSFQNLCLFAYRTGPRKGCHMSFESHVLFVEPVLLPTSDGTDVAVMVSKLLLSDEGGQWEPRSFLITILLAPVLLNNSL